MKVTLWICALVFIVGCKTEQKEARNAQTLEESPISTKQMELIYTHCKSLPNRAQVSIALIKNGQPSFYGVLRKKDSLVTVQNEMGVFEIGSISKVLTATLLAHSVLEQKLELTDSINDYLNFPLKEDQQITFEQLATHTSGLPRVPDQLSAPDLNLENPYKDFDEAALKNYLMEKMTLSEEQGLTSSYSNLGFGLLGYVLSVIDSTSYEGLLQKNIALPYQMTQTTTNRTLVDRELVQGINDKGQEVSNWDLSILAGAGGVLSTTHDLAQFALAEFNPDDAATTLTQTETFTVNDTFSMGLGWALIKQESGAEWLWHNGGTGGYTSSMILNPKTKNGVIVLSNITALGELTKHIGELSPALMDTLEN